MSKQDLEKLAFVTCRVDYCNALLTGFPQKPIRQLQLIQNDELDQKLRKDRYIIEFKVLLIIYRSINGLGPKYSSEMFAEYKPGRSLISAGGGQPVVKLHLDLMEIRSAPLVTCLKKKLKTAFIELVDWCV